MKKLLLILSLVWFATSNAQYMNDWVKKTSFAGDKRTRAVAFVIGDYAYVGTGLDTAEMTHNDLWRYDAVLDTWTQMVSLPSSTRRNASAASVGGKGYLGLGADSATSWMGTILDDWWEYDPDLNSWTQKANYPGGYDMYNSTSAGGVYFATAFSLNDKIYICGGKMGPDFYGTDLWEYDPLSDSWTRKADFPGLDRYQLSSFAVEGKGYVGMGIDHDLYRKDWWQYDPLSDSWVQVADLPGTARGASSTFVIGQRAFVVFGTDGGFKDELWEYNPFTDSWQIRANFPADGRKNGVAFTIGDKGYAGLGKGYSGKRKSLWQYTPLYPVGIEESESVECKIFPNPATEFVSIEFTSTSFEPRNISVFDLTGRLLFEHTTLENKITIPVSELRSGNYLLNITKDNTPLYSNTISIL